MASLQTILSKLNMSGECTFLISQHCAAYTFRREPASAAALASGAETARQMVVSNAVIQMLVTEDSKCGSTAAGFQEVILAPFKPARKRRKIVYLGRIATCRARSERAQTCLVLWSAGRQRPAARRRAVWLRCLGLGWVDLMNTASALKWFCPGARLISSSSLAP